MFVVVSRFRVANGMEGEVRSAFRARPHEVEQADGFVRMEVMTPLEDDAEFWLVTYWSDEASFRRWHRGHPFKSAHRGIPKGLKLERGSVSLTCFRHVAS